MASSAVAGAARWQATAFGAAVLALAIIALATDHYRPTLMDTAVVEMMPNGEFGLAPPRASSLEEMKCHWTYSGENSPAEWGTMCDKKYPTCDTGKTQSPIDITSADIVSFSQNFLYAARWKPESLSWKIPPSAVDTFSRVEPGVPDPDGVALELFNGHTYQVEHIGATLHFGNTLYTLKHFHMHTVSEHTFDGGHYDLEMQFVHTASGADGKEKVLVIGCFYQAVEGITSPQFFKDLVGGIPRLEATPTNVVPLNFKDMAQHVLVGGISTTGSQDSDFAPNFINYFAYTGSFTTPPCTEGVQWILLRNPVYVAPEDVAKIKDLEGSNYRPTQPLNGRKVYWVHK